jgi:predicted methyltransferase MtxX (methanogen marker protein 4)
MDDLPDTGADWVRLVGRRLTRLERRLSPAVTTGAFTHSAFLMPVGADVDGWEEVPDLVGLAPAGWQYVRRAQTPPES